MSRPAQPPKSETLRSARAKGPGDADALAAAVERLTDGFIVLDRAGCCTRVNGEAARMLDCRPEDLIGRLLWCEFPAVPSGAIQAACASALDRQAPVVLEQFLPARSRWLELRIHPGEDGLTVQCLDITARKSLEALLDGQKQVLELMANGATLSETLDTLLRDIEERSPEMLCSVLVMDRDGLRLRHGAAPRLPADYTRAIDGVAIGPCVGSCGTAAFRREPVIVADIATDPLWAQFKDLALAHGLRACWSTPIFDLHRKVLGTFALYFRDPGRPTPRHQRLIDIVTQTAAIALGRENTLAALRESEERFHRVFTHSPVPLSLATFPEGLLTEVNAAALSVFGFEREDIVGKTTLDLNLWVSLDDRARHLRVLQDMGEINGTEVVLRKKDGTQVVALCNVNRVQLNGRDYSLTSLFDITGRKQTETARDRSLALTRATLESTADGILVVNTTGKIETYNRRFAEMWRLPEEVLASGDDARAVQCVLEQLSVPEEFLARVRHLYDHPDEESFDAFGFKDGRVFERYSCPNRLDGQVIGRVWSFRDVTDRVRAQAAQTVLEEQLRQATKMEAVGRLAGGIAHDFNNILTAIGGHVSLLRMSGHVGPGGGESLDVIAQVSDRAANLTRQLLAYSRKQALRLEEVDLNEIVRRMTHMLARTLGEDIEIRSSETAGPVFIRADESMMEQVLMNLAVNARDAMPQGGWLSVGAEAVGLPPPDTQSAPGARAGSFACLRVADSGSGIPPEILAQIFDPFFTTKEVGKGTGLGLATVYGIVQQHEGWITVGSEVGRGTTFCIYLPLLATPARGAPAQPPPLASDCTGHETILLVEDEEVVRSLVRTTLEMQGYRIIEAANGEEALAAWRRQGPEVQLLLTDMVMPGGMSGRDLALRLLQERPELPVIYMSGYSPNQTEAGFPLQEGVNFMSKPFELARFVQTVRSRLDAP